jgi:2-keto-4-pentenoate hydratase
VRGNSAPEEEEMRQEFEELARDLAGAWRVGGAIPLPAAGAGPATRADAYAIQDRMAELIGGRVAGWKVGATVRAVQVFEGHDGPLPGRIFADRLFDSPAQVPARLFNGVKVECEFAFRLTRELPAGRGPVTRDQIAPSLSFHPAFELAGSRFAPGTGNRAATTFDGIADNGSGGAAVLGAAVDDWQRLPFETMAIDARIDDSPPIQIYTGAYRRDPATITAETFSDLRARGVPLPVGTCVLTGSLSLPTPVRKGQTVTATFAGLPQLTLSLI